MGYNQSTAASDGGCSQKEGPDTDSPWNGCTTPTQEMGYISENESKTRGCVESYLGRNGQTYQEFFLDKQFPYTVPA